METLSPFFLLVFSVVLGFVMPCANGLLKPSTNYTSFVYNNCSGDTFTDSNGLSHSQTLSTLFQELVSRSYQSKFYKATVGDSLSGVSGRFHCNNALTDYQCHQCVARIPEISRTLCSKSIAGKIRLSGCYLQYETDQFSIRKAEILPRGGGAGVSKYGIDHKNCDESGEAGGIEGFVEKRDAALEALEEGVVQGREGAGGRYETEYGPFQVEAECDVDLGPCDCGECVNVAVEVVKEECPQSVNGGVFLDRCSVSFQYYYGGGGGGGGGNGGNWYPGRENGETGKQIAIVLGGAGALVLGFLFLLLIRSCGKKDDVAPESLQILCCESNPRRIEILASGLSCASLGEAPSRRRGAAAGGGGSSSCDGRIPAPARRPSFVIGEKARSFAWRDQRIVLFPFFLASPGAPSTGDVAVNQKI